MRFEERELKPYAEPVTASLLKQGEANFSVQYVDGDGHIPIVETWVFAGRKLSPEDTGDTLYFQEMCIRDRFSLVLEDRHITDDR